MRIRVGGKYLKVFDDWASLVHLLLGAISTIFGILTPMAIIYAVYQYIDDDKPEEKKGDLIEFTVGVAIAATISRVLGWYA
jgi:hypothetical protein